MLYHFVYAHHPNQTPIRAPMPIIEHAEPRRRAPNPAKTIVPTPTDNANFIILLTNFF
jgi:hypothetical protein